MTLFPQAQSSADNAKTKQKAAFRTQERCFYVITTNYCYAHLCTFGTKIECKNVKSYIETKFFRCLVGARKNKNMTQSTYSFVPIQDFTKPWTDKELYEKYRLDKDEIEFIESMITSME